MEGHGGNFLLYLPYYPGIMVAGFFPWVIFLPGAFSASLGKRIGNAGTRNILLSWIIVTVILMTIAATKLPHYILFAWPAMAVITAAVIVAAGQNVLNEYDRKWLRGGIWFSGPVGFGIAAGLIGIGYFIKSEGLTMPGLLCGAISLVMTIICCYLQVREKFDGTVKVVLAGILILIIPLLFVLLPTVEAIKISPHIAKAIREKTDKDAPVAMYKYAEPTLNFYVGRNIAHLRKTEDVVNWLKGIEDRVLIIPRKDFEDIRQNADNITFEEIASKKGINYSKGREVEVIALLIKTQIRQ
jgi:4-amino-4-deoxy-L-arabinose transferase-like glycosyltransferase